jgi:hypothetical protein
MLFALGPLEFFRLSKAPFFLASLFATTKRSIAGRRRTLSLPSVRHTTWSRVNVPRLSAARVSQDPTSRRCLSSFSAGCHCRSCSSSRARAPLSTSCSPVQSSASSLADSTSCCLCRPVPSIRRPSRRLPDELQ